MVRTYQTDHLHVASSEFGLQLGEGTQLGGADGGEVILFCLLTLFFCSMAGETNRVREEDSPAVANEVVERDRASRGLSLEVRGSRAETEARVSLSVPNPSKWDEYTRTEQRVPEPLRWMRGNLSVDRWTDGELTGDKRMRKKKRGL